MTQQLLEKLGTTKPQYIGKTPVVVLPLRDWQKLEFILEEYHMSHSRRYRRSIQQSRKQIRAGKLYTFDLGTGKFKKIRKV